jgi:subtilase family serine protease
MLLCVACGGALVGIAPATAAAPALAASPRVVRVGAPPRLPADARDLGTLSPKARVAMTFALAPRDPEALKEYATAVSTPGSSVYRQYLTPQQIAQRFGPTESQINAVEDSLRAHGLTPGAVSPNRFSLHLTATAQTVDRALGVTLERLALPGGRTATAAQAAPALDAGIARFVQAVIGLNSMSGRKPLLARPSHSARQTSDQSTLRPHIATGGPQPCSAAAQAGPAQHAYTADQLASAYGMSGLYGAGDQGQGQTIALYELEPDDPADIGAFQACYGTHANVSYVTVDGGAGVGPGTGEAALDIEAVIGLAPKANFLVYQGPNSSSGSPGAGPYDVLSTIVSDDRAQVISASWGQCEAVEGSGNAAAESTLFEEAAAQGQTFVSASGDDGSEDCYAGQLIGGTELAVDDPASQEFVTGVGGTSLGSLGPRPTESVWNAGGSVLKATTSSGAGGGGLSDLWQMPPYQAGAGAALNVQPISTSACGGACRQVPDVSADADPNTGFLIYWNGTGSPSGPVGWQGIGGTSLAAPIWAAMFALANASTACAGTRVGFANPALYQVAATGYANAFNDVTSGENDFTGTNRSRYAAGPGFDMASGLGTPNAAALTPTLCADSLRLATIGPRSSTVDRPVSIQVQATGLGTIKYGASGLPDGTFINAATGRIAGTPDRIGVSSVTIQAVTSEGAIARTSFQWTIGGPPTVSHVSLTGLRRGRPKMSLTLHAGQGAPPLDTFTIALARGLRFGSRARSVTLAGRVPFAATISHGVLSVTLKRPLGSLRMTVSYGTLRARRSLVREVSARRRVKRLTLRATTTDLLGNVTTVSFRVKPSR